MSDSKGAAIDRVLEELYDDLYNKEHVNTPTALNHAKQAVLALLAQEVIDELKRVAAHNNSEYTSDYLEDRITELERLG